MRKYVYVTLVLMLGLLLASCGRGDEAQGRDMVPGTAESGGSSPGKADTSTSKADEPAADSAAGDEAMKSEMAETTEDWTEEEALLSEHILKAGDTMQVMYPNNDNTLYHGLDLTLHGAELYGSLEEAGFDKTQVREETENYDTSGDPQWCSVDGARVLVCDLTVKNLDEESDGDLHMGEFMIAYADPVTRKVTIISCDPVYFSASSSRLEASDYFHYQLPCGESKDMKTAWLIQDGYEAENLYLCVTYDVKDVEEREYFRLIE